MPGRPKRRAPDTWPRCKHKRADGKVCGQFLPKGWDDGDYCPAHTYRVARELLEERRPVVRFELVAPDFGKPLNELSRHEWEAVYQHVTRQEITAAGVAA